MDEQGLKPDKPERTYVFDERGYFAKGTKGGPGNPNLKKTSEFRKAAKAAVTVEHVRAVVANLINSALEPDNIPAIKEFREWFVGDMKHEELLGMIEKIEDAIGLGREGVTVRTDLDTIEQLDNPPVAEQEGGA